MIQALRGDAVKRTGGSVPFISIECSDMNVIADALPSLRVQ
jgi:hypothetical protein